MEVIFDRKNLALVVRPVGEIDHHSCEYIREKADKEFIEKRLRDMEIDMSDVSFIDSSMIGLIMGRHRLVKSLGGSLYITGVRESAKRIIKLSGLEKIIDISYEGER